jgi:hypothetical protein
MPLVKIGRKNSHRGLATRCQDQIVPARREIARQSLTEAPRRTGNERPFSVHQTLLMTIGHHK